MKPEPTLMNNRIYEIDSIRGVALLGILFMNIMNFAGEYIEITSTFQLPDMFKGPMNQFTLFLVDVFVTTNFYTLFSILFGLGFYIFFTRAKDKTIYPYRLYYRRMFGLLIIGLVHAIFIWYGDILVTYALVGCVLALFIKFPPRVNITIAVIISVVMTVLFFLLYLITLFVVKSMPIDEFMVPIGIKDMIDSGSYLKMISFNFNYLMLMLLNIMFLFPMILMMFLIGLYIGQKEYHKNIKNIRPFLKKVALITLSLGLPIKIFTAYIESYRYNDIPLMSLSEISGTIGGPLMAVGYLAVLALLFDKYKKLNNAFSAVGRMALTNYIMQSVVMISIFYGLRLFGKIDMMYLPIIVVVFFIIQIMLSKWWMSRYKFGPLEYMWRVFTYNQKMSIKK